MIRKCLVQRSASSVLVALAWAAGFPAQAQDVFSCKLRDVTVFNNRIHVRCTTAPATMTALYFYALPTASNTTQANRLLTLGSTALVANRKFIAHYGAGDTSGVEFGCQANDCRRLQAFGIE